MATRGAAERGQESPGEVGADRSSNPQVARAVAKAEKEVWALPPYVLHERSKELDDVRVG